MNGNNWNFLGRLLVPTLLLAAATWYWMSLWDARMRDQNLILIQPVVFVIFGCYVLVVIFELRRYRTMLRQGRPTEEIAPRSWYRNKRLHFMAVAGIGVALFPFAGAIPATLFSVLSGMLVLGVRNVLVLVAVPLCTTTLLWAVFVQGFGIRMPLLTLL